MPEPEETLQIVNETASLEKRDRLTGRVRVSTRTEVTDELVSAELESNEVEVTRLPINRQVDVAPPMRSEGNVTIVPVVEEILVVEKRLVLVEEIHIRRDVAKVSVIGIGMRSQVGVARTMFEALAQRSISIEAIATSEIKISVLIDAAYTELAVRALHTAYGLDAA